MNPWCHGRFRSQFRVWGVCCLSLLIRIRCSSSIVSLQHNKLAAKISDCRCCIFGCQLPTDARTCCSSWWFLLVQVLCYRLSLELRLLLVGGGTSNEEGRGK